MTRPTPIALRAALTLLAFLPSALWTQRGPAAPPREAAVATAFTLDQVMSAPYPTNLTAAGT